MAKKLILLALFCAAMCAIFSACAPTQSDSGKISVISTIFPGYDFARQIAGDRADVKMLLSPGEETHSYEPSPKDIAAIGKCDLFICTGDENDVWVEKVLASVGLDGSKVLKMTDCVVLLEEDEDVGGTGHGLEHGHEDAEPDPHVWTSPKNAMKICDAICEKLCAADTDGDAAYRAALAAYTEELKGLDTLLREVVDSSELKTIVVGERFPFRYLAEEYGLEYYAAFPGCASDTEPSAKTVAALIDRVKQYGIPCVFYIEFSNMKTARTIADATGADTALLHSCHNVTKAEFDAGVTYIDLMTANAAALKKALNRG